jgi:site-specific recombinase XerD
MSETAPVRFSQAIDTFVEDQRAEGRINSPATEREYRGTLTKHAEDVDNRDPANTSRDDVKRTLTRWVAPEHAIQEPGHPRQLYRWMVEEGLRPSNSAEQTKRPRWRQPRRYRLTRAETVALLKAARGTRERRLIYLGICAGLRRHEIRGAQGRHFRREGAIWVSADIGKGQKERWIPVIHDLEPVWAEISANIADDEYVLPAQRFRDPGHNRERRDYATPWPPSRRSGGW